jgi:hypothetical protein
VINELYSVEVLKKLEGIPSAAFNLFDSRHTVQLNCEWWRAYIETQTLDLAILGVLDRSSRTYSGFLPLQRKVVNGTHFWNHRGWTTPTEGLSDFYPFLVMRGQESETMFALAEWLRKNLFSWEFLHLDLIPKSSVGWQEFVGALEELGFSPEVSSRRNFYKIDTNAEWDVYDKCYLHPKLADLRNRRNRLLRAGLKTEVKTIEHDISRYLDGLIETYQQRRRTTEQPSVFDLFPSMKDFLGKVIYKYEQHGWVRLSILISGETILAYQLDWIHNNIWYHYMPAFDETFAMFSPGKILLYETIKMAFADPNIHEFNFMRGQSAYKTQFANQSEPFVSIRVDNPWSFRLRATRQASKLANWRDRIFHQ